MKYLAHLYFFYYNCSRIVSVAPIHIIIYFSIVIYFFSFPHSVYGSCREPDIQFQSTNHRRHWPFTLVGWQDSQYKKIQRNIKKELI